MSDEDALRVGGGSESAAAAGTPDSSDKGPKNGSRTSKDVAAAFGDIISLLVSSPAHKHFFLSDLEWLVLPPLLLRQCQVIYSKNRPVAVALWAFVSEAVEKELEGGRQRLRPSEWKSGDRLWLIELISPGIAGTKSAMDALIGKLSSTAPSDTFRFRRFNGETGRVEIGAHTRDAAVASPDAGS